MNTKRTRWLSAWSIALAMALFSTWTIRCSRAESEDLSINGTAKGNHVMQGIAGRSMVGAEDKQGSTRKAPEF